MTEQSSSQPEEPAENSARASESEAAEVDFAPEPDSKDLDGLDAAGREFLTVSREVLAEFQPVAGVLDNMPQLTVESKYAEKV